MGFIHDQLDNRNISIENIGISGYKLPITFKSAKNYNSVANINSGLSLESNVKGAHLSRIIEVLDEIVANNIISINNLDYILEQLVKRIESDNAYINIAFDIVFPKKTPVSNKLTYLNSNVILNGQIKNCKIEKNISLSATGAMLCPNSKAISRFGAHSQKCNLKSTFYGNIDNLIVEEVLEIIFNQFSSEVYGLVKSADEKYMTEKAYMNPKFSEDLIRDTLIKLKDYYNGGTISTEIENLESIHQHNVYSRGLIR